MQPKFMIKSDNVKGESPIFTSQCKAKPKVGFVDRGTTYVGLNDQPPAYRRRENQPGCCSKFTLVKATLLFTIGFLIGFCWVGCIAPVGWLRAFKKNCTSSALTRDAGQQSPWIQIAESLSDPSTGEDNRLSDMIVKENQPRVVDITMVVVKGEEMNSPPMGSLLDLIRGDSMRPINDMIKFMKVDDATATDDSIVTPKTYLVIENEAIGDDHDRKEQSTEAESKPKLAKLLGSSDWNRKRVAITKTEAGNEADESMVKVQVKDKNKPGNDHQSIASAIKSP